MKKPSNFRSKILSCLPKAASPVTFQLSPPSSPVARKGFTAPTISMIPKEMRRKPKTESFVAQEPTSPKVSCMGQVKNKKKKNMSKTQPVVVSQESPRIPSPKEMKKKPFANRKSFNGTKQSDKVVERVPSLGQMKQFSSSRGMLNNFDWTACEKEKEEAIVERGEEVSIEPRKEVNLWKRRNKASPIHLQV
ncbi:hypothetical protein Pint_28584 [Pistacia integerrima]|uniref:Uncharacterized protein n=1 Tax=Pistacia integerrima TaxID=434235 RepID=A0ACC0YQ11_9ROSI|nr:hypothetical protein Pint_28584 [Pistacia integerrima]